MSEASDSPSTGPSPEPEAATGRPVVNAASAKWLLEDALEATTAAANGTSWEPPVIGKLSPLFAKYSISRMIGRGGMGAVYLGSDPTLDRPVAIKILPPELNRLPGFADRFRREAWALAQLDHPHIVRIYELGTTEEGHLFFVMEYVEGTNLAELLAQWRIAAAAPVPFPPEQGLEIAHQVCEALAEAHAQGILHRDIKPANLLMDGSGRIKLVDFGLARPINKAKPQSQLTGTGELIGTRDYMAPELLDGGEIDARVDVYAVGVLLYEMLTGEVPRGVFRPLSKRLPLDRRLDRIVERAMQADPNRRFGSITELRQALEPLRRTGGRLAFPRGPVAGITLTVLAAGTAVFHANRNPPAPTATAGFRTGLVFEEAFDYPAGKDALIRQSRFSTEGIPSNAADILDTGLTYSAPDGAILVTTGQAALFDATGSNGTMSHITPLIIPDGPETQLWISFLACQTAGTRERFFNLCLRAADDTCQPPDADLTPDEVLAIGMRSRLSPQVWQVWDRLTTGEFSRAAVSDQPTTLPSFLLVRWERDVNGTNERATFWVNPPLIHPPDETAGFAFTSLSSDLTAWSNLKQLRLGAGGGSGNTPGTSWQIDEIRLGWTREAVTPHRPPT